MKRTYEERESIVHYTIGQLVEVLKRAGIEVKCVNVELEQGERESFGYLKFSERSAPDAPTAESARFLPMKGEEYWCVEQNSYTNCGRGEPTYTPVWVARMDKWSDDVTDYLRYDDNRVFRIRDEALARRQELADNAKVPA